MVNFISGLPIKQSAPFEVVPIHFYTTLSDEQFAILAESLFEQAVVQGTGSVTDKADNAQAASECPKLAMDCNLPGRNWEAGVENHGPAPQKESAGAGQGMGA